MASAARIPAGLKVLSWSAVIVAAFAYHVHPASVDPPKPGLTIYVDDDAPPSPQGDGLTWQTAFRYLQDALHFAAKAESGVTEIRVAQGVYKPDQGANVTPGDRNATFLIPSGLALRGGYAGLAGADPDARDFEKFPTMLSGDLLANDGPPGSFLNYDENSFHVVSALNGRNVVVEGMTVTAGNSVGVDFGGGLFARESTLSVTECIFNYNRSAYGGGGAGFLGCNTIVSQCVFHRNRAFGSGRQYGGGVWAGAWISVPDGGSLMLSECSFTNNSASIENGGGLYAFSARLTILGCAFLSNSAGNDGGAISLESNLPPVEAHLEDCVFMGNSSGDSGGALVTSGNVLPTVKRCQFVGNSTSNQGGGARILLGSFIDCLFADNFCSFAGGAGWQGGGTLINCEFRRNLCGFGSGGGGARATFDTTFINCVFNGNDCWAAGGGAFINPAVGPLPERTGTFINCTFTNNLTLTGSGGAIHGKAIVRNSILWNNSPAELSGPADVEFSVVSGGWPGGGNIDLDPLFTDALGPDGVPGTEDDDLRLHINSPCIDGGENSALPDDEFDLNRNGDTTEPMPIDLAGNPRLAPRWPNWPRPYIVDMGALEFQPPRLGDLNTDAIVNHADLILLLEAWGNCPRSPSTCPPDVAPPGGDNIVNVDDLLALLRNWG